MSRQMREWAIFLSHGGKDWKTCLWKLWMWIVCMNGLRINLWKDRFSQEILICVTLVCLLHNKWFFDCKTGIRTHEWWRITGFHSSGTGIRHTIWWWVSVYWIRPLNPPVTATAPPSGPCGIDPSILWWWMRHSGNRAAGNLFAKSRPGWSIFHGVFVPQPDPAISGSWSRQTCHFPVLPSPVCLQDLWKK